MHGMQCRSHSRGRTSECLFVTACSMDEYVEEKRTEKNLIVCSGISVAKTTNNTRSFVFVCSQLQHTYRAVFLLLVTAASDLLVHNILLNCVLLSPIVCGSVRPKLPRQTPLGHNPLVFYRSWIGWGQDPASWVGRGQEYGLVSVFDKNTRRVLSYDVLRQQKKEL